MSGPTPTSQPWFRPSFSTKPVTWPRPEQRLIKPINAPN